MSQIFVFTAGNKDARQHLNDSILNSVNRETVNQAFSEEFHPRLKEVEQKANGFYAWGAIPGPLNKMQWRNLKAEDWIFCVYEKQYHFVARIIDKFDNEEFAEKVWGRDPKGKTWQFMYFLTKPEEVQVSVRDLGDYFNRGYMGFTRIGDDKLSHIRNDFGTIDEFIRVKFLKPNATESNKSSKSNIMNIFSKVKSNVSRLVYTNKIWTEAELNKLKEEYPKTDTKDLAEKLGRTLEAVRFQAKKHGLKKTKGYMQSLYEGQMANPPHLQSAMEEKTSEEPEIKNEKLDQNQNIKFLSQLNRKLDTWLNSSEGENHEHRELIAQVPNMFSLLCKLADNNVVSEKSKSKLAIAITYFVNELDLMPEAIIGPVGYQDDLVISALAIMFVMDYDSKDIVRDSWEGNEDIIALIAEIINNAVDYVGPEIHRQLVCKIG